MVSSVGNAVDADLVESSDNTVLHRTLVGQPQRSRMLSATWPAVLNMSLIGYAVCGVFLGGFSYPHLFLLSGLTISAQRIASASEINADVAGRPSSRHRRFGVE